VPIKVFLRPYRGDRIERDFKLKLPAGLSKGEHRIMLSDADTLNRVQNMASTSDRFMDIPQEVSLINQERTNDKLYVSLVEPRPTVYYEDRRVFWFNGHWFFRSDGHWAYYETEPDGLREHR